MATDTQQRLQEQRPQ